MLNNLWSFAGVWLVSVAWCVVYFAVGAGESPAEMAHRLRLHSMLMSGRVPPELSFSRSRSTRSTRGSVAADAIHQAHGAVAASGGILDPFRNFAAEAARRPGTSAAAASSSSSSSDHHTSNPVQANLSRLLLRAIDFSCWPIPSVLPPLL